MNTSKAKIYKSKDAENQLKNKMIRLVIIFMIAIFVVPCILGFIFSFVNIIMNASALGEDIQPIVAFSVKKDNQIYAIAGDSNFENYSLARYDINLKEGFQEVKQLKEKSKLTLDNSGNLLIVSKNYFSVFPDEPVELTGMGKYVQDISRLFWLNGELYSICLSNDAKSSKIFWLDRRRNKWILNKEIKHYQVTQIIYSPVSIVEFNDKKHVSLYKDQEYKLLYQQVDYLDEIDQSSWKQLPMPVSGSHKLLKVKNELCLVTNDYSRSYKTFIIFYRLKGEGWEEFFKSENLHLIIGSQVFPGDSKTDFSFIVNNYPGSYIYQEYKNGEKISEKSIGFSPFNSMKYQMIPGITINILLFPIIIIFVILISGWIEETRFLEIMVQDNKFKFPTLKRRAFARIIDWLISDSIGILIIYLVADFNEVSLYNMFSWFYILFIYMISKIIFLLLFIFLEAYTGKTPGKYLTGIKVVDYSGEKIGLKKSFLRNLLRVVDQMFYGLIGIYLITISQKFQRLGDIVADTIVILE